MNWLAISLNQDMGIRLVVGLIAWFAQMGFHEGGHAWAAYWLGDKTAYHMGKRTVNPFAHVNWDQPMSVITTVVAPAITALYFVVPLGMAWVPVNPGNFRHPSRDHAIVAFAGPAGGFIVALAAWLIFVLAFPLLGGEAPSMAENLLGYLLFLIYLTAVVYSVFNLIPVPPLDGSNILYYFANENLRRVLDSIRQYGFLIIILVFWVLLPQSWILNALRVMLWPFYEVPPMIWGS